MEHFTFVNFVCLIGVIPLIIFLLNRNNNDSTKYLFPFILLIAFGGLYEVFGYYLLKGSTKYWFRIYTFLEFYTILYFYYRILKIKLLYFAIGLLYFIIYFYLLLDWSPLKKGFDDMPLTIAITILVIISSLLWFVDVFKKIEDIPLYKRTIFFYISSLLIYFSGTFLVFIMGDYMFLDDSISRDQFWIIIVIFGFFLRLTLIFTVWKAKVKLEH